MPVADIAADLALLEKACREAAEIARDFQAKGFAEMRKDKGDPFLTEADLAIDTHLHKILLGARPDYGWLSEETEADASRMERRVCFIVDPIDGTRGFVQRTGEFAISVGLVAEGKPVAAAVCNPMQHRLISGALGLGLFVNGKKVVGNRATSLQQAPCLVSVTESRDGLWQSLESALPLKTVGSIADKLALVAIGEGASTASLRDKHLWDICAGHILCQIAGCVVTDLSGEPIIYNAEHVLVNGIIVAPPALHAELSALLKKAQDLRATA